MLDSSIFEENLSCLLIRSFEYSRKIILVTWKISVQELYDSTYMALINASYRGHPRFPSFNFFCLYQIFNKVPFNMSSLRNVCPFHLKYISLAQIYVEHSGRIDLSPSRSLIHKRGIQITICVYKKFLETFHGSKLKQRYSSKYIPRAARSCVRIS